MVALWVEVPAQEGQLAVAVQSAVDQWAAVAQSVAADQLVAVDRLAVVDQSVPALCLPEADRAVDRVGSLYAWVESESVMA